MAETSPQCAYRHAQPGLELISISPPPQAAFLLPEFEKPHPARLVLSLTRCCCARLAPPYRTPVVLQDQLRVVTHQLCVLPDVADCEYSPWKLLILPIFNRFQKPAADLGFGDDGFQRHLDTCPVLPERKRDAFKRSLGIDARQPDPLAKPHYITSPGPSIGNRPVLLYAEISLRSAMAIPPIPTVILLGAMACLTTHLSAHDPITTKLTWAKEISRLFAARCIGCHRQDGPAPFPISSYEQARPWAVAIREEVLARRMPPWNAVRGFGRFSPDPSLSQEEIRLIVDWVNGGAPEGDPRLLDPAIPPAFTASSTACWRALPRSRPAAAPLRHAPRHARPRLALQRRNTPFASTSRRTPPAIGLAARVHPACPLHLHIRPARHRPSGLDPPPLGPSGDAPGADFCAFSQSATRARVILSATSADALRNFAPWLSCVVDQITSPSLFTIRTDAEASCFRSWVLHRFLIPDPRLQPNRLPVL